MDASPSIRLEKWLEDPEHPERSQEKLGKILGVTQAAVSQWKLGKARPDPDLRGPLEQITGIAAVDWYTEKERARLARVHAALVEPASDDATATKAVA